MENFPALMGLVFQNMVFIVLGVLILQLLLCYAIQTIADKQDLPASWMAWVPLLQLYPMIKAGGVSFVHFFVLLLAGIPAIIAGVALGPVGLVIVLGYCVWMLGFFVRVFWNVAENRGVTGWVGILAMIPVLGLLFYSYIAFHDGAVAPSKLGLLLGVVCFVLPTIPQFRNAREMAELGQQFQGLAAASEQGDQQAMAQMMQQMMQTMQGMEGFESQGDPEEMSRALSELAAAMGAEAGNPAVEPAGLGLERAAPPVFDAPELKAISEFFECPDGTRERGAAPPGGAERWCERMDPAMGPLRHGGYATWHAGGQLREVGMYRDGKREGVWTRWYASGGKQAQAEFAGGLQHGLLLTWDEFGRPKREVRFHQGEPIGG